MPLEKSISVLSFVFRLSHCKDLINLHRASILQRNVLCCSTQGWCDCPISFYFALTIMLDLHQHDQYDGENATYLTNIGLILNGPANPLILYSDYIFQLTFAATVFLFFFPIILTSISKISVSLPT